MLLELRHHGDDLIGTVPACSGATVASDGVSVSFAATTLAGAPVGGVVPTHVVSGTLVAKGR